MASIRVLTPGCKGLTLFNKFVKFADRSDLRDCKVAVITIVGLSGKDKKFIIDSIIRYLDHICDESSSKNDWLKNDTGGIKWDGSIYQIAPRLVILDKVFKLRATETQEALAVVLVVVDGSLGTSSRKKSLKAILTAAVAALISSVFLFNVYTNTPSRPLWWIGNMDQDDRLTLIGKLCPELVVLCHDWTLTGTTPFGWVGGNQTQRCRRVFMLPPSDWVETTGTASDNGTPSSVTHKSEIFLQHLRDFIVGAIGDPNSLSGRIAGDGHRVDSMTFGDLCSQIVAYAECYDRIKDRRISAEKGISKIYNDGVLAKALKIYTTSMARMRPTPEVFVPWSVFKRGHQSSKKLAKDQFQMVYKMGSKRAVRKLRRRLAKQIALSYEKLRQVNQTNQHRAGLRAGRSCSIQ